MPEANDKAPDGTAEGGAQLPVPGARPDTAAAPDGGSEAPAVDPAQARSVCHTPQMLSKRHGNDARSGAETRCKIRG